MTRSLSSAIDNILDQFEKLIDVESSERNYARAVLSFTSQLIGCQILWRLQSIDQAEWMSLQRIKNTMLTTGQDVTILSDSTLGSELTFQISRTSNHSVAWSDEQYLWLATSIAEKDWREGVLVAQFAKSANDLESEKVIAIMTAVGELLLAHAVRWQSGKNNIRSQRLQGFAKNLSTLNGLKETQYTVVNDLRVIFQADQVVLLQKKWWNHIKVSSVSDAVTPNPGSKLPKELLHLGSAVVREKTFILNDSRSAELPQSDFLVGIPLRIYRRERDVGYCLVVKWTDAERYEEGMATLRSNWALINHLVTHSLLVQALPSLLRKNFFSTQNVLRFMIRGLFAAMVTALAAWLLFRPIDFSIEGKGILEPTFQGYIFAANDGVVDEIQVKTGEYVRSGQSTITILSTDLALRLEEAQGEVLALQEKRNGYRLSLNQLGNDERNLVQRSQLSADIAELDLREVSLQQKIELLEKEISGLALTSPLDGEIVTENIREILEHRPVARGEALLHVADTEGKWHFKVEVPDFEAGHLLDALASQSAITTRIRLASDPENDVAGWIQRVADSNVTNPADSPRWLIYVDYSAEQIINPRFGSTANVRFICGKRPAWYVWLRPIWESLHRRFWL